MNMVFPDLGKKWVLDECFRLTTTRPTFLLDLFQSLTVVVDASVSADFTISTFTGYAQVTIARADWTAAVMSAGRGTLVKTVVPTFTCSAGGPQNVSGWILREASSGILLCGQNFDVARSAVAGWTESLSPFQIQDKTLT